MVTVVATPATPMLVRGEATPTATPGAVAVRLYDPAVPFAVRVGAVAIPFTSVTAVFVPPRNAPDAPEPGTVNVTVVPLTGLPNASVTRACGDVGNAVLT